MANFSIKGNGTSDPVIVPKSALSGLPHGTLDFCIKVNTSSGYQKIFYMGNALDIGIDNNGNLFGEIVGAGNLGSLWDVGGEIDDNEKHHIEFSWDGTNVRCFIDGNLVKTVSQAATQFSANDDLYIGSRKGSEYFLGLIDEVRISNIARHTSSFTPETMEYEVDDNTLLLLHFNEGGGDYAYDATERQRNGRVNNVTREAGLVTSATELTARRIVTDKIPSLIGMNYYHESMGFIARTNAEIDEDLDKIKEFSNRIKLYYNLETGDTTNLINITRRAKNKGFYVVWTVNKDDDPLITATYFDGTLSPATVSLAQLAEVEGVGTFIVGNEYSIKNDDNTLTDAGLIPKIKTLAISCKAVFSGIVGYQDGGWAEVSWSEAGIGSLDKIFFNTYEAYHDFERIYRDIFDRFGNNAGVGEFSAQYYIGQLYPDGMTEKEEVDYYFEIKRRLSLLYHIGFNEVYYFTFSDENGHGIKNTDGNYFLRAWSAFFKRLGSNSRTNATNRALAINRTIV